MADIVSILERVLAEAKADDQTATVSGLRAELDELKERQGLTRAELDAALDEYMERRLAALEAEYDAREGADDDPDETEPETEPEPERKPRTRPGRRAGMVYNWDVDDDGKVVQLPMARAYSGPDEPDRVELAPKPAETGDDTEPASEAV